MGPLSEERTYSYHLSLKLSGKYEQTMPFWAEFLTFSV